MASAVQAFDGQTRTEQEGEESDLTSAQSSLLKEYPPATNDERVITSAEHDHSSPQTNLIPRKPLRASKHIVSEPFVTEATKEQTGDVSEAAQISRGRRKGIFHNWRWELGGCITFLAALLAIVGILRSYQGQTLPHWPWRVSINSIVSILATVFKGAILLVVAESLSQWKWIWVNKPRRLTDLTAFEDASRGPFGSLKFLVTSRIRLSIASVGAAITILTLALDPFIQQVVRYHSCSTYGPIGSARILRTSSYGSEANDDIQTPDNLPIGLQTAISIGLFDPTVFTMPYDCPSVDCKFPRPVSTLGYCSMCNDTTDILTLTVSNISWNATVGGTADSGPAYSILNGFLYNTTHTNLDEANFTLLNILPDDDFAQQAGYNLSYFGIAPLRKDPFSLVDTGFLFMLADGARSFSSYNQSAGPLPLQPYWNATDGYGAATCSFEPCIRTYSVSVHNNTLNEVYDNDPFILQQPLYDYAALALPCLNDSTRQKLINADFNISADTKWVNINDSLWEALDIAPATYDLLETNNENCVYVLASGVHEATMMFLTSFLSGDVADERNINTDTAQLQLYNQGNITFTSLQQSMENISEAITKYIRQNGNAGLSQPALGIAAYADTCVQVYWWWLAYPTAIAVLTLVLFTVTIFSTREAADWKSSILPLIPSHLWGIDGCYDNQGRVIPAETMEENARMMTVQLDAFNRGWKFGKLE